jgi:hypothetical protein
LVDFVGDLAAPGPKSQADDDKLVEFVAKSCADIILDSKSIQGNGLNQCPKYSSLFHLVQIRRLDLKTKQN